MKNYYDTLLVSPDAPSSAIRHAYHRLLYIYEITCSESAKQSVLYLSDLRELEEAYGTLSDQKKRVAYDSVINFPSGTPDTGAPVVGYQNIAEAMTLVSRTIEQKRREPRQKHAGPGRYVALRRIIVGTIIAVIAVAVGGGSYALAKPKNVAASPFIVVGASLAQTAEGAVHMVEEVRGVVALFEQNVISGAVQYLRIDRGLKEIPAVSVSTNDMGRFPSPDYPLFPDYVDRRYSQFKYMVNSDGIISVDKTTATTDEFLNSIRQTLARLAAGNQNNPPP